MPGFESFARQSWAPESLLSMLSASERASILALGHTRQYTGSETLFRQGDRSQFIVIIIDGYAKITAVSENGAESLLAIRTAGDVVGELAAVDGLPRSATARAADAVVGRVIMKPELDRLLRENHDIAHAFSQAVSAKLREATRWQVGARHRTKSRLARVLVELYHGAAGTRDDEGMAVIVTQPELASLISASEPAVHQALRALRAEGSISTGYGRLIIKDVARLQRIAREN